MQEILNFDFGVLSFIQNNLKCPALDFLMPIITLFGEGGVFWIAVTLLMLCFKKTRKAGFVMALSLTLGLLVVNVTIKPIVDRQRPYELNSLVQLLIDKQSDGSFPSGHTVACFECAVSLIITGFKKWGYAALTLAFLVAFSRLYLYVHYPTDVITSMILGTAFAFIAKFVVDKLYAKHAK